MGGAAGAAAGAATRARKRLIAHFTDRGALSADKAIDYAPDRGFEKRWLEKFVASGVLHQVAPGNYWLDAEELTIFSRNRRRRAGALIGAAVALGAALGFVAGGN